MKRIFYLFVILGFAVTSFAKLDASKIIKPGTIQQSLLEPTLQTKIDNAGSGSSSVFKMDDGSTIEASDTVEIVGGNNITTEKTGTKEISIKTNDDIKVPHRIILNHQERPANVVGFSDDMESYDWHITEVSYDANDGLLYTWENSPNYGQGQVSTTYSLSGDKCWSYGAELVKMNLWDSGKYDVTTYMYFDSDHNADFALTLYSTIVEDPTSSNDDAILYINYGNNWLYNLNYSSQGDLTNYITENTFNKIQYIFDFDDNDIKLLVNDVEVASINMPTNTIELLKVSAKYIDNIHIGTYTQHINDSRNIAYEYDFDVYQDSLIFNKNSVNVLTKLVSDNASLKNITFYNTDEVAMEISDEVKFKNKPVNSLEGYNIGDTVSVTAVNDEMILKDKNGSVELSTLGSPVTANKMFGIDGVTYDSNDTYTEGNVYLVNAVKANAYDQTIIIGYDYPNSTNKIAVFWWSDITQHYDVSHVNKVSITLANHTTINYDVTNITYDSNTSNLIFETTTNFTSTFVYNDRTYLMFAGGDYNVDNNQWLGDIFIYKNGQRVILHDNKLARADFVFNDPYSRKRYTWLNYDLILSKNFEDMDYILSPTDTMISYPHGGSRGLTYDTVENKIIDIRPFDVAVQIMSAKFTPNDETAVWDWELYNDANPYLFGYGGIYVYNPSNRCIYFGTGKYIQGSSAIYNTFYKYDIGNNIVTTLSSPDVPVDYAGAYLYDGNIYAMGGNTDSGCTDIIQKYDIASNSWSTLSETLPMSLCKFGIANDMNNNNLYIFGGELSNGTTTNEVYSLDKSNFTFTEKANMPISVKLVDGIFNNGYIYTAGGNLGNEDDPNDDISDIYKYDIANNTWSSIGYLNKGEHDVEMFKYKNRLYFYQLSDDYNQPQYLDLSNDYLYNLLIQDSANIIYLYPYYFVGDINIFRNDLNRDKPGDNVIFHKNITTNDYIIYSSRYADGSHTHAHSMNFRLTSTGVYY